MDQFQTRQTLLSGDLFFNSQATLLIWSAHTVSLVRCGRPHRSFCQFRRTTWTLLLVVSLLLLQDSGTLFLWTVELLHLLTYLRSGLRHFSLFRHNPHCSTRLCTMARYKCIDWLIDWTCTTSCHAGQEWYSPNTVSTQQGDYTVLSATHTRTFPCLYSQPQGITAIWLVLTATIDTVMARLSWPGWLVAYWDKYHIPGIEPGYGHPSQY